ncbi:hypothetical protein C0993_000097 [Termitomyces sp. T159_Od127]|nr:hypothetical protein C0993_000097 [Termitomyces sp. T159_Od127]
MDGTLVDSTAGVVGAWELFREKYPNIDIAGLRHHPHPAWAICTSATRTYASSALRIAGIPIPDVFVAAEDVKNGKPLWVASEAYYLRLT